MSPAGDARLAGRGTLHDDPVTVMAPYACDYCQKLSVAYLESQSRDLGRGRAADWLESMDRWLEWTPAKVNGKDFPDVPPQIASTADEAHRCHSIGASRAAVALARAVVEATAKSQGITRGLIMEKIDAMHEQQLIRDGVKDAAHEIRLSGNEVAHGDLVSEPVSTEEAAEVLSLLDLILYDVFQGPAQTARLRTRRTERTSAPPPT